MAKYPRLTGSRKISQDYTKVNDALGMIEEDVNSLESGVKKSDSDIASHKSSTQAHSAASITYTGDVIGATTAKQAIDTLKDDFNKLVAHAGDGTKDTEIILARGNKPTLGDRLDATDAQLADTENQLEQKANKDEVNILATLKADKTEVNSLATAKADKSYVDISITTLDTKINAQASGSPKGTYATLAALQAAFPTGNSNIYVVSADGKWHYWNGSAWTAGGIYQATGIGDKTILRNKVTDGAINHEKTDFLTQSVNLFDKSTTTDGYYIHNNGSILVSSTLFYSDYISVNPGDTITITRGLTSPGEAYDQNKNRVGVPYTLELATSPYTFTVPANVYYLRLNNAITGTYGKDTMMVVKGGSLPVEYVAHEKYINGLIVSKRNIKNESVSYEKLDADLKSKINPTGGSSWSGKNIVTFGDSITWYDGKVYNANTTEAGVIVKGYQSYMRDKLGVIVDNQGVSGNTTPQIYERIKTYASFGNMDAVTILAGTNDFRDMATELIGAIQPIGGTFDTTTFIGAYQASIEHILTVNPQIKLFLFTPIKAWTNTNGLMPETYPNAVLELAALYALPCLDLYHSSGINDLTKGVYIVDTDAVSFDFHPSTKGYKRMADVIVPFFVNH